MLILKVLKKLTMKRLLHFVLFITPILINAQIESGALNITLECEGGSSNSALDAWLQSNGGAVSSNDCGTVTWENDFTELNGECSETIIVVFTATGSCGTDTTIATVFINDTEPPSLISNNIVDYVLECDDDISPPEPVVFEDNCSNDISISYSDSVADGFCLGEQIISRTWAAVDDCDNTTILIQTITLLDTTAPILNSLAEDMSVTCDGNGNTNELNTWLSSNGGATATDNCGNVFWSNDFIELITDCTETVSTTVTFTATDDCGNSTTTQATFSIEAATSSCPDTPIVLTSQAEVDAFPNNYPGCSELDFGLTISGSDIVDLTPLSGIASVIGNFSIENNPLLINLEGLNNITELNTNSEFNISNNNSLTDISALINMVDTSSNSYFLTRVSDNPQLISLNGLQVANSGWHLIIDNNDSLINLDGLGNVLVEEIFIRNNDALQNFNGISGIVPIQIYIEGNTVLNDISEIENLNFNPIYYPLLSIKNNPNLEVCNINPFCVSISSYYADNVSNPDYTIENNAPNCNSLAEVAFNCGLVPSNDECEGAAPVTIGETIQAYNELGTQSSQMPSCNDVNRADVWFSFTPATSGLVDILADSGYNLQLWEGDCTNLTQVANACAANSLSDIAVVANTDYYIQVWSEDDSLERRATGLFNLTVQDASLSIDDAVLNDFLIHPNPTHNILNFSANVTVETIAVYNALGQNVMTITPKVTQGTIDMSQLSDGFYFLKVNSNTKVNTFKVLKN